MPNPCSTDLTAISPECDRNRLDHVPWEDRESLTCAKDVRKYAYSIAPFGNQFMIHPALNDETVLLVVWDGLKSDFVDGDVVRWPEHAAEAVAAYVKYKILLLFDRRPDLAAQYYVPANPTRPASGIYAMLRLALLREQQEALVASNRDQEYEITLTPNASVVTGFGAQDIPFLSSVTQYTGTDQTALAAVPTTGLTVPFYVTVDVGNGSETWIIKAGTDATDTDSGLLRPNDYATSSNERIWTRQ